MPSGRKRPQKILSKLEDNQFSFAMVIREKKGDEPTRYAMSGLQSVDPREIENLVNGGFSFSW